MAILWRGLLGALLTCAVAGTAAAGTPAVKLAVVTFALDDFSAALSAGSPNPADDAALARVTEEVRKLLQDSGRYEMVTVDAAEQTLVGVVKRISRTEYQVHIQLRDTKTGTVLTEADTGLRMGAMDSWNRGAVRLVKDRLLKNPG
ncbi:DUF2380 domain-containing protein [Dongia sp.]|uniref:DUF2380 domain-containing protein n=1 Tax=Dongia sp. TaxID=1977262 RepID=UPI0037534E53